MTNRKMETRDMVMWGLIALVGLVVVYVLFFQGGASASSTLSTTQAAGQQAASGYGGMVGGC